MYTCSYCLYSSVTQGFKIGLIANTAASTFSFHMYNYMCTFNAHAHAQCCYFNICLYITQCHFHFFTYVWVGLFV